MPLALLLQKLTGMLTASAKTLTPWLEIVPLESLVIERARGAFLVNWFGPRLPVDGLSVRAHIVNVAELNVRQSERHAVGGPNLTAPLLGFAGQLGGILLSPAGLGAAAWVVITSGITTADGATAAAAKAASKAAAKPDGPGLAGWLRELPAVVDLLGGAARLMNASVVLLDQARGPRTAVRNPLVRRILDLADALAPLAGQALGAVSLLIVKIGPVLQPIVTRMVWLGDVARATFGAIGDEVQGLTSGLDLLSGELSIKDVFARVRAFVTKQVAIVAKLLPEQLGIITETLSVVGKVIGRTLAEIGQGAVDALTRVVLESRTSRVLQALAAEVAVMMAALAAAPPQPPPAEPGMFEKFKAALPKLPEVTFPSLPQFPDLDRMKQWMGGDQIPALDADSILHAAEFTPAGLPAPGSGLHPAARQSLFAPERKALVGGFSTPAEALIANRKQLDVVRQTLSVVVGKVLPADLRVSAASLLDQVMATIGEQVYGDTPEKGGGVKHPVRDPSPGDELRPVVTKLRLRMSGATRGDARLFEQLVTQRIQRRRYPVVASATTADSGGR